MKQIYSQFKTVITMLLFCLAPILLFGQTKIGGTVTDENKEPLPGVSIVLKGTSKGTVTDINGRFLFNVEKGQVLTFKFLGYKAHEITIGDLTEYNVIMIADTKALGEVTVTALGVKRKPAA